MNRSNPEELVVGYTKFFPLGFIFNEDAKNVLFVGGGAFSGPKYFLETFHNVSSVDVVEIDPDVIEVAKEYFNLSTAHPRLNIFNEDGRSYLLSSSEQKYDLIVLDAYSKDVIPFHLMTSEYFRLFYNSLTDNGVIISNVLGSLDERESTSDLYRSIYKTMSTVFPGVYAFPMDVKNTRNIQNIILAAVKNPDSTNYTAHGIRGLQLNEGSENHLLQYSNHFYDPTLINISNIPVLRDQYAPVENLLDPITSKYASSKQSTINSNANSHSIQWLIIMFIMPASIAAVWIFYMQRVIWKTE